MTTPSDSAPLRGVIDGLRLARPGITAVVVVARPALWPTAIRLALGAARRGWWHRWPVSPLPPASYIAFRAETMLGRAGDRGLTPSEVVAYLRWCRRHHTLS